MEIADRAYPNVATRGIFVDQVSLVHGRYSNLGGMVGRGGYRVRRRWKEIGSEKASRAKQ